MLNLLTFANRMGADILEPIEWLNRAEALRSEVSGLYVRQALPTAL
jgi:hypothetical protein